MGFDDDDFFAGGGGFGNNDAFAYNDEPQYEPQIQQQPRSQVRPTRQRRASLGVTSGPIMSLSAPIVPSKPMRTKSSDNFGAAAGVPANSTRAGGRRQPSSEVPTSSSSRSGVSSANNLNGRLESVPGRASRSSGGGVSTASGDRSVTSNGSNSQRRTGARRASMAAGISSSRNVAPQPPSQPQYRHSSNIQEEADYGYGYEDAAPPQYHQNNHQNHHYNHHEVEDMGYGDQIEEEEEVEYPHQPVVAQEEPVRARRQRRCSIADVVNTASIQPTQPDYGYGSTESYQPTNAAATADDTIPARTMTQSRIGAAGNASISNMAIPMTLSDEPKRTNRRGSIAMLGNIGRTKATKEPEPAATAKKSATDRDRQRQRQGTLLDRVGAGTNNDGRGSSRAGTTSYSDRILSK